MQLMTFNSLLMFDIVFVFFLFLVGVTCLVYYLPTGKQHQHNNQHQQHMSTTSSSPTDNCQHHCHHYCHHNHLDDQEDLNHEDYHHQHHCHRNGYQLLDSNEENKESTSIIQENPTRDNNVNKDILTSKHEQCRQIICQYQNEISSPSSYVDINCHHPHYQYDLENHIRLCCEENDEEIRTNTGEITTAPEDNLLLPSGINSFCHHQHHHHHQQQHHHNNNNNSNNHGHHHHFNLRQYRITCEEDCLDDSDDSGEDIIYSDIRNDCDFRNLNRNPFVEHFVIVNETERALPPTPRCCYVKAKFDDVRECVGPIADV